MNVNIVNIVNNVNIVKCHVESTTQLIVNIQVEETKQDHLASVFAS